MKIAVLSDVHGNLPALERVLDDIETWGPEQVIVNGDLINRGTYSRACLRLIQRRYPRAHFVKGNHETFVLHCAEHRHAPDSPAYGLRRFVYWTVDQLGSALGEVRRWPDHLELSDLGGGAVHVTHGTRLGNRDGIHPDTDDEALEAKLGDPRDLFVTAHTHKPLVRRFGATLVVNVGSVGSPFDRDPRTSYGRLTYRGGGWKAEIRRLDYDRERAERDFADSGFIEVGGPLVRLMQAELAQSRGHMGPWTARYQRAVLERHITVAEAVEEYLASL